MSKLWLLRGGHEAEGWKDLEKESRADEIDLVVFDRAAWALMYADEAPTKYKGLEPEAPADGLYVSEQGQPIYVLNRKEVAGPEEIIEAIGPKAKEMLKETGDTIITLQRLGLAY